MRTRILYYLILLFAFAAQGAGTQGEGPRAAAQKGGSLPPGARAFCDHQRGDPHEGSTEGGNSGLAKVTAPQPFADLNIADLNRMSHAAAANAIAAFTGDLYELSPFFQNTADTRAFYGDSSRIMVLIDALTQRAGAFTAADHRGIPYLVEVLRAGFFLGFYHGEFAYLKNTGAFIRRLQPAQAALFASPHLGFGTAAQRKVLSALGQLMGAGTFGEPAVPGVAAQVRSYLQDLDANARDQEKTSALYSLINGFDYALIAVHLYALRDDATRSPWNGRLDAVHAEVAKLSLARVLGLDKQYLLNNAAYWLGRWGRFVAKDKAVATLTAIIDAYGMPSIPGLEAYMALDSKYGGVDAHGTPVDMKAIKADLEARLLPVRLRYDDGALIIRASAAISKDKLEILYWTTKEVEARFHRLLRTASPLKTPAPDDSLTMVIYGSPEEYEYNRFLNGLATNNGGIYIENSGSFYTYERTPDQSVYSLEELFRHEYVHYLAGRFIIPGTFGGTLYANDRLTWFDEGLAEFLAGSTRDGGVLVRRSKVRNLDERDLMTLSQVTRAAYSSGFGFYDYACLAFNWLYSARRDLIFGLFARLRAGDAAGFDAQVAAIRSGAGFEDAYRTYLLDQIKVEGGLTLPATSLAYLEIVGPMEPAQLAEAFRLSTGQRLSTPEVLVSPRSSLFRAQGTLEVTGDSLTAWKAADSTLDGLLKGLTLQPWAGWKTATAWFGNPVPAGGGRIRYEVFVRGKIGNGTLSIPRAARPRTPVRPPAFLDLTGGRNLLGRALPRMGRK